MQTRTKLRVAATVVGALIALCAGLALWTFHEDEAAHTVRADARNLEATVHDLNLLATGYLVQPSTQIRDEWAQRLDTLRDFFTVAGSGSGEDNPLLTEVADRVVTIDGVFGQLVALPETPIGTATSHNRRTLTARLLAETEAVLDLASRYLSATEDQTVRVEHSLIIALMALAAVAATAFVMVTVLLGRGFVVPVLDLVRSVDRIGRGDLDTPLHSTVNNEVGDLTRQIDATRLQLRRTLESERAIAELLRHRDHELQQRAADLQRSNDDLAQFAYIASHDLRTPLRGIDNLALWIEEDAGDALPEAARGHLDMMKQRIQRMEQLLQDLLAYSQAGRVAHRPESVDTRRLAEQVVEMVAPPPGFTVAIAPKMPILRTARIPLQQVLTNLVTNAVQHHDKPPGRIGIDAAPMKDGWCFSVADDGPGIPPEHYGRVFEMFQTLKPKDQTDGTGMGLTLIQRLAQRQGGHVWIEPAAGPRGTVVRVYWPESPEETEGSVAVEALRPAATPPPLPGPDAADDRKRA